MNKIFKTKSISKLFYATKLPIRKWKGITIVSNNKKTPDDYLAGEDLNEFYKQKTQLGFPVSVLINRNGVIEFGDRWVKQTSSYVAKGYNYKYMSIMLSFNPEIEDIPEQEKNVFVELVRRIAQFIPFDIKVYDVDIDDIGNIKVNNNGKPVDISDYTVIPYYSIVMSKRWQHTDLKKLFVQADLEKILAQTKQEGVNEK